MRPILEFFEPGTGSADTAAARHSLAYRKDLYDTNNCERPTQPLSGVSELRFFSIERSPFQNRSLVFQTIPERRPEHRS